MTPDPSPDRQRTHPTWKDTLFLFSVMGGTLSGFDSFMSEQSSQNIGLCAGFGFGVGLCFSLIYLILSKLFMRLPPKAALASIGVIAFGLGHILTESLHGYTRLSGPYPSIGLLTIVLSYGLPATSLWLIGLGLNGLAQSNRRRSLLAILAIVTSALWFMSRMAYPDIYPGGTYLTFTFAILMGSLALIISRFGHKGIGHWYHRVTWSIGLAMLINGFAFLQSSPPSVRAEFDASGPISGAYTLAFFRALTDIDRDGYSSMFGDGDCAAFDETVHPGAAAPKNCASDGP